MRRILLSIALCVLTLPAFGQAGLIISEYVEGSSNNKAIEIYNGTAGSINLSNYRIQMYFNGNTNAGLTVFLAGSVAPGQTYVVAHTQAAAAITSVASVFNGAGWFNGDDAIVLRNGVNNAVVDSIGQIGFDPGTQWGTGLVSTEDNTLRRKSSVTTGDSNPFDVFDPSIEWNGYALNTFDGLGSHHVIVVPPTVVREI